MESRLTTRIDNQDSIFDQKFETQATLFDNKLDTQDAKFEKRLGKLETRVQGNIRNGLDNLRLEIRNDRLQDERASCAASKRFFFF